MKDYNEIQFEQLPVTVQQEVRRILKGWRDCYVYKNKDGSYKVSCIVGIFRDYTNEPYLVARFRSEDIYTEEERRKNAAECWGNVSERDMY